jgi:uncharacterized protein YpmB
MTDIINTLILILVGAFGIMFWKHNKQGEQRRDDNAIEKIKQKVADTPIDTIVDHLNQWLR